MKKINRPRTHIWSLLKTEFNYTHLRTVKLQEEGLSAIDLAKKLSKETGASVDFFLGFRQYLDNNELY